MVVQLPKSPNLWPHKRPFGAFGEAPAPAIATAVYRMMIMMTLVKPAFRTVGTLPPFATPTVAAATPASEEYFGLRPFCECVTKHLSRFADSTEQWIELRKWRIEYSDSPSSSSGILLHD